MSDHRILVTGGAGFIGSHVVASLLDRGYEVVVLDNLSTGKRSNIPESARLRLVEGDLADRATVREALRGCTAFVHLAAVASVEQSVRAPVLTSRTNHHGTVQLFQEAAELGVARALYASSAAIYGDAATLPVSENAHADPLTPYAADKLSGEHYLAFFHRSGRLNATAFRFFNVFGPRQDPTSPYSGVVSIFMDRAKSGEKITVFGSGEQTRDFIYVADVVRALLMSLDRADRPLQMPIYNVARGEGTSLRNLLDTIRSLPGVSKPLEIEHAPARRGDIEHSLADVSRIEREMGWRATTSVAEGLTFIASEGTA